MNAKYLVMGMLLSSPFAAWGLDTLGSVSMQVNVQDNTCSVDAVLGNVVLGPVALRDIQNRGGSSTPVPFSVLLKGCGIYARSVSIYAGGTTIPGKPDVLALSGSGNSDTAQGIGISLLDRVQHAVAINQSNQPVKEPLMPGGDTAIDFNAQYVLTGTIPRAGRADASVTLTFAYE